MGSLAVAYWLARTRAHETVPSQEVGRDIAEWRARRAGKLMRAMHQRKIEPLLVEQEAEALSVPDRESC